MLRWVGSRQEGHQVIRAVVCESSHRRHHIDHAFTRTRPLNLLQSRRGNCILTYLEQSILSREKNRTRKKNGRGVLQQQEEEVEEEEEKHTTEERKWERKEEENLAVCVLIHVLPIHAASSK